METSWVLFHRLLSELESLCRGHGCDAGAEEEILFDLDDLGRRVWGLWESALIVQDTLRDEDRKRLGCVQRSVHSMRCVDNLRQAFWGFPKLRATFVRAAVPRVFLAQNTTLWFKVGGVSVAPGFSVIVTVVNVNGYQDHLVDLAKYSARKDCDFGALVPKETLELMQLYVWPLC
jgi:hypothetical protein